MGKLANFPGHEQSQHLGHKHRHQGRCLEIPHPQTDAPDETAIPYHDILYDLIERLSSEDDRQMLYLYLDGKSHSEIAKAFGLTTVNVRQRIHRITKKLIKLNEQDL